MFRWSRGRLAKRLFGEAGETLREDAFKAELSSMVGPADAEEPAVPGGFHVHSRNCRGRKDDQWFKILIESPGVSGRNEELDMRRRGIARLIFTAANDGMGSEFTRLAVGGRLEFGGRQQDRNNE